MKRILTAIVFMSLCIYPFTGDAAVTLPWSCDFDSCVDWTYGQPLNCCGLSPGGQWGCDGETPAKYEQINSTGALGGSGKSQVHWVGAGDDDNSGGLLLDIAPSSQTNELWIRYYIKYQDGYEANTGYSKDLYINLGYPGTTIVSMMFADQIYITGGDSASCSGCGWASVFSDHQWHYVEVHLKFGAGDGVKELWIDGVKRINAQNINYGNSSYRFIQFHRIGSNQGMPTHSGCKARFYDSLAISTTGPIGPAGGPPPGAPQNILTD